MTGDHDHDHMMSMPMTSTITTMSTAIAAAATIMSIIITIIIAMALADEIFENIGVETAKRYRDGLRAALAKLSEEEDYGAILRAKGIVQAEDGRWLHLRLCAHGRNRYPLRRRRCLGRLCVGTHIDRRCANSSAAM